MRIGITERGDAAIDLSWKYHTKTPKILIIKDPHNLIELCSMKDFKNAIIHCTITGLGGTLIEPNVKPPEVSIEAYKKLVHEFGPERVVLRVDPLFVSEPDILQTQYEIIKQNISRVRISFLDLYKHIIPRFLAIDKPLNASIYYNNEQQSIHAPLPLRLERLKEIQEIKSDVEICGEPGISCTGCVSIRDIVALRLTPILFNLNKGNQRPCCNCIAAKFELLSTKGQCPHGCVYCYWR